VPKDEEEWKRWVNRGKHKPIPGHSVQQTITDSLGDRPSRYFPGIDIRQVETEAASRGQVTPSGEGRGATLYKVHRFGYAIGASCGIATDCIRVESTNGDFHGYPIAPSRYVEYHRRAKQEVLP